MDESYVREVLEKGAEGAAREMLGWVLVHDSPIGKISGRIVETEAYTQSDEASHSFRGQTMRNAPMFSEAGTIYIYFTYGMHFCMNIVTGKVGQGEAVLIRALEPRSGIEIMQQNRKQQSVFDLANGPAKLVQAMAIDKKMNGHNIFNDSVPLHLLAQPLAPDESIVSSPRIGISKGTALLRRFYVKPSKFTSRS